MLRRFIGVAIVITAVSIAPLFASGSHETAGSQSKPVDVTYYFPLGVSGPLVSILQGMTADFNKSHPAVNATAVFAGSYDQTLAKVQAAIMGGTPPDFSVLVSADLHTLIGTNAIIPLDSYIKSAGTDYYNDFFPAFWLNSKSDGKIWSIPFQRSTCILYYNKDLFKKAGLDPNTPPATWADLISDAQKLTIRNGSGETTQWGIEIGTDQISATYWFLSGFVYQQGQAWDNEAGNKVYIDTPAVKRAVQLWVDLVNKYKVMPPGVIALASTPTDFLSGKTAMIVHSTGTLGFIKNQAKFSFGTAFLPAVEPGKYGTTTGGGNFYIFNGVPKEKQQASWEFIKWMTEPAQVASWSMATGYVATRKSAWDLPVMQDLVKKWPQYLTGRNALNYAHAELETDNIGKIETIINNMVESSILGKVTVDQAVTQAQDQANAALSAYQK